MGVDHVAIFIDDELLAQQITNQRRNKSDDEIDRYGERLHDAIEFDRERGLTPYEYGDLQRYSNDRWASDMETIRLRLLAAAQETDSTIRSNADTLYRFIGVFGLAQTSSHPFNEYGFAGSAIFGVKNAQIWHSFFKRIDFECLRALFDQQIRSLDLLRIESFEDLVGFAKAFDDLLVQAIEKNKTLYLFAS